MRSSACGSRMTSNAKVSTSRYTARPCSNLTAGAETRHCPFRRGPRFVRVGGLPFYTSERKNPACGPGFVLQFEEIGSVHRHYQRIGRAHKSYSQKHPAAAKRHHPDPWLHLLSHLFPRL